MTKKLLILVLIFLNTIPAFSWGQTRPYDNNWYIRVDKSEFANSDRKYFDPPAVGTPQKKPNKIQRILYRADKPRLMNYSYHHYDNHVSGREYKDCSYYLYVDCSNYTFCRCWQCRNYAYPIVDVD